MLGIVNNVKLSTLVNMKMTICVNFIIWLWNTTIFYIATHIAQNVMELNSTQQHAQIVSSALKKKFS
jgi:hypothetical protein